MNINMLKDKFLQLRDTAYTIYKRQVLETILKTSTNKYYHKTSPEAVISLFLEHYCAMNLPFHKKEQLFHEFLPRLKNLAGNRQKSYNFYALDRFKNDKKNNSEYLEDHYNCLEKIYHPNDFKEIIVENFLMLLKSELDTIDNAKKEQQLLDVLIGPSLMFFAKKNVHTLLKENKKNFVNSHVSQLNSYLEFKITNYKEKISDIYDTVLEKELIKNVVHETPPESVKKAFKL